MSIIIAFALQLAQDTELTARHLQRQFPDATSEDTSSAEVELWVSPTGKTQDCRLIRYVGSEEIAAEMCSRMIGSRLRPARDNTGTSVHSFHVMTLTLDGATGGWMMSTKASQMWNTLRVNPPSPGLAVGLSEMPDELAPDPYVSVKLLIDAEGAPLLCEPEDAANETWSGVAWDQAIASKFEQRQSRNDETVPYIRTLVVEFEISGG